MSKLMTSRSGRFAAALAFTLALAACSGGGGGSTSNTCANGASDYPTCTPAAKKPTIGNLTWSEAAGATIKKDATVQVNVTTTDTTSITGIITTTCNSLPVAGATMANWTISGNTGASSISAPTNYGESCTHQVKLTAHGVGGDSTELAGTLAFTVEASPCVAPKVAAKVGTLDVCATPVGIKVSTFYKVPAGCVEVTHDMFEKCWLDFATSKSGVQWVQTSARAAGAAVNPINGAANDGPTISGCYIDKADNAICSFFMIDTGRVFANGGVNYRTSHDDLQKDWVAGSQEGIISHVIPEDKCYNMAWFPPTTQPGVSSNIWDNLPIVCPAL